MDNTTKLTDKLIEKAKEAFILAIEIYNKPTIKYRVEGFSFFICNAWELMLKAHLVNTKGEQSIYFKDNPHRTINLENCIKQVFTNDKAPLRQNLEKIIELRNISTHFITEEYEMVYIPLFQSCIFNFNDKMLQFHNVEVGDLISLNFLNLVVRDKALDEIEVRAKYDSKIADKLLTLNNNIVESMETANSNYAIKIEHTYYLTKNKDEATDTIAISKSSDNNAQIVKEIKNPNDTHAYTAKKVCAEISRRIAKEGLEVKYNSLPLKDSKINNYIFNLLCNYYDIKNNEKLCFVHKQFKNPNFTYSMQAIDFIFEEIKKDPENILDNIKSKQKKS